MASNRRRSREWPWILLLALAVGGVWLWVTPRRAWDRFMRALVLADTNTLNDVVDFPTLRTNLKHDLRTAIAARADGGQIGVPAALSGMLIDPIVEIAVSPEGLTQLVTSFGTRQPASDAAGEATDRTLVSYQYRSPFRVDVRVRSSDDDDNASGIFTFERSLTSWRLVRVWGDRLASTAKGF